jgi:segregation and condensation protein B
MSQHEPPETPDRDSDLGPDLKQQQSIIEHAVPAVDVERNELDELDESAALAELGGAVETPEILSDDAGPLSESRLRTVLESLFLVADRPLSVARLIEILEEEASPQGKDERPPLYQPAAISSLLSTLSAEYRAAGRGIELHQVAGGWQLRTAPESAPFVQRLLQQKPTRLARAQLEVLAIVAYRQPITRPEIDDIRGVDSGGALKTLLERRLLRILGKKEEPGRPLLYGTTREFLEFFNLRDLKDLPTLREYYDLSEEHKAKVRQMHGDAEPELPGVSEPPPPAPGLFAAASGPEAAPETGKHAAPGAAAADGAPEAGDQAPSRTEILAQYLVDDATHLSQIDELIGSVSTEFPDLSAVLSPAPPSPTSAPAAPASDAQKQAAAEEAAAQDPEEA